MIILTSSAAQAVADLHEKFLAGKKYTSVLFIDTAAEPEIIDGDDWWLQADLKSLQDQGYAVERYTITDKDRAEIEAHIDAHDIIYMSGGNTAYLLEQMQKTDSLELIKEKVGAGKPYIGSSAGSLIAGPFIPPYLAEDTPVLTNYNTLNLVNFVVVPHWGSDFFKTEYTGERFQTAYRTDQPPLLLLNDTQYVHVDDAGLLQIINIAA